MQRSVCLLAALAALASLGLPAASVATVGRAATMVVQLRDLPRGFALESSGVVTNAALTRDSHTKDFRQLGRLTGYDATYTALAVSGLTEVDAFASIYKTNAGAHQSLLLTVAHAQIADGATVEPSVAAAMPGNEALVYLTTSKNGGMKVHNYTVAWRRGAVFAEVIGGGRAGTVNPTEVLALAKRQDARIAQTLRG
jgi:hypothetical protein